MCDVYYLVHQIYVLIENIDDGMIYNIDMTIM